MQSIPREISAKILQFRSKGTKKVIPENENEGSVTTSITIPKWLHEAVKQDANRCHRSWLKQLVAILDVVYTGADVELHGTENYTPQATPEIQPERRTRKVA